MANDTRVRSNAQSGTITNNPLTNSGTSLTSTQLAAFPVIDATQHAVLILDPEGNGNGPEIVYMTAHVAASTGCTIVRGREGTSGVSHSSVMTWVHGPVVSDFFTDVTSTTRPTGSGLPYLGQKIFETDTDETLEWNGVAWRRYWKMPWGLLPASYAQQVASQSNIPTSVTTNFTTLTITDTFVANRRIKITVQASLRSNNATDTVALLIREGATQLQQGSFVPAAPTVGSPDQTLTVQVVISPTAGSHTYAAAILGAGTGPFSLQAGPTFPAFIMAEDIGPNGIPT